MRPTRRFRPALVSAALLALAAGCDRGGPVRVVLITLDTLRYDRVAPSGEGPGAMSQLAAWGEDATRFERCFASSPSTQPTHASLFTGLHPWQHGVSRNRMRLAERFTTAAETLRGAGFSTAAVVASFPVSGRFGFAQGFERFEDDFGEGRVGPRWRKATPGGDEAEGGYYALADHVVERSVAQLDAARGRRQFFWFHFFDPHSPYGDTAGGEQLRPRQIVALAERGRSPAAAIERARRLYDVDVRALDRALERLLARLAEDEDRFVTHVVITADHGESFGEEGSMAHGRRLIPSQIQVPCLIRSPRLSPGSRHDVAGSIDLAATLLSLAGLPGDGPGRDLSEPPPRRARAYGMRRGFDEPVEERRLDGSVAVLSERLYYAVIEDGRILRGHAGELLPPIGAGRANDAPAGEELLALFASFERQLLRSRAEIVAGEQTERALRALGYAQ